MEYADVFSLKNEIELKSAVESIMDGQMHKRKEILSNINQTI